MRHTYLVCYDVTDNKRREKIFKICKNHGQHLQFSVFECELDARERTHLEHELRTVLNLSADQALIISLGPSEGRGDRVISAIGTPYTRFDAPCFVV